MSAQIATRIFVMCKTEKMPGSYVEKIPLMANAACQKVWNRDFNGALPDEDRLTTFGGWMNPRCFLLIDNGPVDISSYTLVKLRDEELKEVLEPHRFEEVIKSRDEIIARHVEKLSKQT
ncbi:hypothetical protein BKA61DRAFT_613919 [Leptodontidium sp. MPI-SDFR-AT-0119]|nr:hypothetical protein BKA61DRAFT_613919 [Leptodontidium sp. MPI-SDFR-AT-0119]